ncbi:armadillo-type fold protein [Tanacetum coccineum]
MILHKSRHESKQAKGSQDETQQADDSKITTASSDHVDQVDKEEPCPQEEVNVDPMEGSPKLVMNNGVNVTGNEETSVDQESSKQADDDEKQQLPNATSKEDIDDSDTDDKLAKSESKPEPTPKNGEKKSDTNIDSAEPSDSSHVEGKKEAEKLESEDEKDNDVKESAISAPFQSETEKDNDDVQVSSPKAIESKSATANVSSPSQSDSLPDVSRIKKAARSKRKQVTQQDEIDTENAASPSKSETPLDESRLKKAGSDSDVKPQKRAGKMAVVAKEVKSPATIDSSEDDEAASDSDEEPPLKISKKLEPVNSGRKSKQSVKAKQGNRERKWVAETQMRKASKAAVREVQCKEAKTNCQRGGQLKKITSAPVQKRSETPVKDKESDTIKYDESLVGKKVKVWWPEDKMYYEGVIESFDAAKKKHKHGGISVITILDDLRSQLAGHIKTNEEQSFANDSLKAELERYKNTRLQNLRNQVESNKSLKIESEKLKADNNALEESYLEELVWLRNTTKVVTELLQSYGQPVQTVPICVGQSLYLGDVNVDACTYLNYRVNVDEETLKVHSGNQLQGKDDLMRKLKAQIGNMKEVSADSNLSTLEFQALKTENTQLKEELTAVRMKPGSDWVANTPLPRKETVSLVKKTNVCINLSTGIKSVTEASKSKSKCKKKTHRNLPARSENVKRVDNPLRNLNKRNHVDSSLCVKRTGFILKSVSICKTCNECLVFGNHDKCGVKILNSMNAKNPKVKDDATVKQVWKATGKIFASVGSKWRPTGRKFTLGDTCPLTRITKPEVVPLEKSGSVSTIQPANNVNETA